MKREEKEQYLREYQILKGQGKPFFPYAVLKDSVMACIVLVASVVLERRRRRDAEHGSSRDRR